MTFFTSALPRLSHKVVATNMSLDSWYHQLSIQPIRFVQRVEMCTALTVGQDAWGTPVGKTHRHTLLRVVVVPTPSGPGVSGDTILIERVFSTGGAYHSVTPIEETFSAGGTLSHPDVHDRICVISDGPSTALAHHLEVDRTLAFCDGAWEPYLTLTQFAQILEFLSRTTRFICDGRDCQFQSRLFAFACLTALSPTLPRSTLPRKTGKEVGVKDWVPPDDDFELGAKKFWEEVPWWADDPASVQTLRLIGALKDEPRQRATASPYH